MAISVAEFPARVLPHIGPPRKVRRAPAAQVRKLTGFTSRSKDDKLNAISGSPDHQQESPHTFRMDEACLHGQNIVAYGLV